MFLDRGFELTTIEAIAAQLGMTKRTVYARYEDKAALFKAAVRQAIDRWTMAGDGLKEQDTGELASTLTAIARARVAHLLSPQGLQLQRILNTESYRFPELALQANDQGSTPVVAFLADVLARYANAGTITVERPHMAAAVFLSMVSGGQVRTTVTGMTADPEGIEDRIAFSVDLFLKGLGFQQ
jgi:AcrR family transcriptional regulator